MSVTDKEMLAVQSFANRNAPRADWSSSRASDRIRAFILGPLSPEDQEKWWRGENSLRTGECCGKCGRPLEAEEAVYRATLRVGQRTPVHANICGSCVAPSWAKRSGTPCRECGRPVIKRHRRGMEWTRPFCSDRCSNRYYNGVRNERNAQAREKVCEVCRESFTATRRDAKTCSRACKQKAYRQRQKQGAA